MVHSQWCDREEATGRNPVIIRLVISPHAHGNDFQNRRGRWEKRAAIFERRMNKDKLNLLSRRMAEQRTSKSKTEASNKRSLRPNIIIFFCNHAFGLGHQTLCFCAKRRQSMVDAASTTRPASRPPGGDVRGLVLKMMPLLEGGV